jgi:predicted O-methyltransferase YrrM
MNNGAAIISMPQGRLLDSDMDILKKYSSVDTAVDLGTFFGLSAYILSMKAKKVITIDLFEDFGMIKNYTSKETYKKLFAEHPHYYKDIVERFKNVKNIRIIKGLTYVIPMDIDNVDLLFIDADHSYEGIKRDYDNWYPLIPEGGLILFHDTVSPLVDVGKFISMEITQRTDIKRIDDSFDDGGSTMVFKKLCA